MFPATMMTRFGFPQSRQVLARACEQSRGPAIDHMTSRALYLAIFWACDLFSEQVLETCSQDSHAIFYGNRESPKFFGRPCMSLINELSHTSFPISHKHSFPLVSNSIYKHNFGNSILYTNINCFKNILQCNPEYFSTWRMAHTRLGP